uniref:Chromosome 9 open reading frame 153 n=1 Tax=Catagonus wagneri TaxID=51154 RepID=A0A8C3WFD5_9CETA
MLLSRDRDPGKDDVATETLTCSLPELYAFVENFSKESAKLNRLNTHYISPSEAQKILSQNLNAVGETDAREDDRQPLLTCKVVRKEERPESMSELLHRSLLSSPLDPLGRLHRSQRRPSRFGIPPPVHTFPYEVLVSYSRGKSAVATKKKVQGIKILCRLGVPAVSPEKFVFEDKIPKYLLVDPEKQFLDLRDLEWRYYKGIVKWKHIFPESFINIDYDSEKRFVVSQQMPRAISPPLVHKSLVIYPRVNYQKSNLKWNVR